MGENAFPERKQMDAPKYAPDFRLESHRALPGVPEVNHARVWTVLIFCHMSCSAVVRAWQGGARREAIILYQVQELTLHVYKS